MKKSIVSLIAALLFTACGAEKAPLVVAPKPLPSWYSAPPQSDQKFLYATAEGHDKKEAIANALEAMASTLSVTVASTYTNHTTLSSGSSSHYTQQTDATVSTTVHPVRISNYTLVASKEQSFRHYLVLIKSDKKQLFDALKEELEGKMAQLSAQEKEIKSRNIIEQLRFYKKAAETAQSMRNSLAVMQVLNSRFHTQPYLTALHHFSNRYDTLRSRLTFSFQSDKEAADLIPVLSSALSQKKLLIAQRDDPYHLSIYLHATIEEVKSMGFELARAAVVITVKDHSGATVGSNKLNITGQSTQGMAVARENIAVKLKQQVNKEGIETLLGLQF